MIDSYITQLGLPQKCYKTTTTYIFHKKCGWWGKKILDKVSRRASQLKWINLGMTSFTNDDQSCFGYIEKYVHKNVILTLSEVYAKAVTNSQFLISLYVEQI